MPPSRQKEVRTMVQIKNKVAPRLNITSLLPSYTHTPHTHTQARCIIGTTPSIRHHPLRFRRAAQVGCLIRSTRPLCITPADLAVHSRLPTIETLATCRAVSLREVLWGWPCIEPLPLTLPLTLAAPPRLCSLLRLECRASRSRSACASRTPLLLSSIVATCRVLLRCCRSTS